MEVVRLEHCRVFNSLQWRHNEHNGVSNHRRIYCLLRRLFRRRSKKTSKLRVTDLWRGKWRHHVAVGYRHQHATDYKNTPRTTKKKPLQTITGWPSAKIFHTPTSFKSKGWCKGDRSPLSLCHERQGNFSFAWPIDIVRRTSTHYLHNSYFQCYETVYIQ